MNKYSRIGFILATIVFLLTENWLLALCTGAISLVSLLRAKGD
jgi:hypothetical protein